MPTSTEHEVIDVTGPLGGLLAGAWGAGAVMGYGFASRTIGRRVTEMREDMLVDQAKCASDIADLTARLRLVEDRAYNGLERQLGQARASTVHLMEDGIIKPPLGDL